MIIQFHNKRFSFISISLTLWTPSTIAFNSHVVTRSNTAFQRISQQTSTPHRIPRSPSVSFESLSRISLMDKDKNDDKDDESDWDAGTEYPSFDPDEEVEDFPLDFAKDGLGIDIGKQMGTMSAQEIAEIKAEAAQVIDGAFSERLEELETMKRRMKDDFEKNKKAMNFASELNAQRESEKLMNKIDAISEKFLSENEALRMGTKLAAEADANMVGKGLDVGSWGSDEDGNVVTTGVMIGGVNSARERLTKTLSEDNLTEDTISSATKKENKILIIVDENEKMDKMLVEEFKSLVESSLSESTPVQMETITPSKPAPLGGLDAQTAIVFTNSLSDRGSMERILERILTRTTPAPGQISAPPTHLVCVTSLGTERTNKMPYSMQNMFTKKLDKKRAMEEAIVSTVRRRDTMTQCPLDYTIVKMGNIVKADAVKDPFTILSGDSLDGDIGLKAAAQVLLQSVAYQPAARNTTFSAVGGQKDLENTIQKEWDDLFIVLDGPELYRMDIPLTDSSETQVRNKYERLSEYMLEWADTMFVKKTSGTGLTTPVTVEPSKHLGKGRSGVRILFKQTRTGGAYKSKSEEREIERQSNTYTKPGGTDNQKKTTNIPMAKQKKEGGLEVIVEMTEALPKEGEGMRLRVRGRRCNMADDTVVKEISEGVLIKRLREGVNFWMETNNV